MKKSISAAPKSRLNAAHRNTAKAPTGELGTPGNKSSPTAAKSKAAKRSSLNDEESQRGADNSPAAAQGTAEEEKPLEPSHSVTGELTALLDSLDEAPAGAFSSNFCSHPSSSSTALPSGNNTAKRGSQGQPKSSPRGNAKKSRAAIESLEGPGLVEDAVKREDEQDTEPAEAVSPAPSPKAKAGGKRDTKLRRTKTELGGAKADPGGKKELTQINIEKFEDEQPVPDQALDEVLQAVTASPCISRVASPERCLSPPISEAGGKQKTKKEMERQYHEQVKQIRELGVEKEKLTRELEVRSRQIQDLSTRLQSTDKDLQQYTSYTEEINKAHTDSARMMTDASSRLAKKADERALKAQQQIEKLQQELESVEVHASKIESQAMAQKEQFLRNQRRRSSATAHSSEASGILPKVAGMEIATQESQVPGRRKSGGGSEAETVEPPQPSLEELEAQLREFEIREAKALGRMEVDHERSAILQEKLSQAESRVKEAEERMKCLEAIKAKSERRAARGSNGTEGKSEGPSESKPADASGASRSWRSSIADKISKFRSPSLIAASGRRRSRSGASKATRFSTQVEWTTAASMDIMAKSSVSTVQLGQQFEEQLGDEVGAQKSTKSTHTTGRLPSIGRTRSFGARKSEDGKNRRSGRWSMLESAKCALGIGNTTQAKEMQQTPQSVMPEDSRGFESRNSDEFARAGSAQSAKSAATSGAHRSGEPRSVVDKMKRSLPSVNKLLGRKSHSMNPDDP